MLIVTEPKYLYSNLDFLQNSIIMNVNANVTGFYNICLTPPLNTLGGIDVFSPEFDQWYITQILTTEGLFMNLMMIMSHLRNGRDVILLVYRGSEMIDAMNEALLKLIQVRYDYNYQIVDSENGFNFCDTTSFSIYGILQFDADDQRYQSLLIKYGLLNTNEIIAEAHV